MARQERWSGCVSFVAVAGKDGRLGTPRPLDGLHLRLILVRVQIELTDSSIERDAGTDDLMIPKETGYRERIWLV